VLGAATVLCRSEGEQLRAAESLGVGQAIEKAHCDFIWVNE